MARQAVEQNTSSWNVSVWLWGGGLLSVGLILIPSTIIVVSLGMLPTAVAWLVDRSREKFATYCVGGLNFCGVFPFLLQIWFEDSSTSAATEIISDVFALAIMYAAAGFGWALFISIPPVVAAFLNVVAQRRVAFLKAEQKAVIDEWGTAVADRDVTSETAQKISQTPPQPVTK